MSMLYTNITKMVISGKDLIVIREGPASQPQSNLSRCKNLPLLLKNYDPP